jgi:hypothetical protein
MKLQRLIDAWIDIAQLGGPNWDVKVGRRDSRRRRASAAPTTTSRRPRRASPTSHPSSPRRDSPKRTYGRALWYDDHKHAAYNNLFQLHKNNHYYYLLDQTKLLVLIALLAS